MNLLDDTYFATVISSLDQVFGGDLQSVILFGSHARGTASSRSDIDLLVLLEPYGGVMTAKDQSDFSRRGLGAVRWSVTPIDLWVRTPTEYEEARTVFGGVEYFASRDGCVLHSSPRKYDVAVCRSPTDIRASNVRVAIDEANRLLELAILKESGRNAPRYALSVQSAPDDLAWRAIQRSLLAVFIWKAESTVEKSDPLPTLLAKMRSLHPAFSDRIRRVTDDGLSASTARAVLLLVVAYLARDPAHRAGLKRLQTHLTQPLERLAAARPMNRG